MIAVIFAAFLFSTSFQQPSGYARPEMLVDTAWLADHLQDANIRIVDMRRIEVTIRALQKKYERLRR